MVTRLLMIALLLSDAYILNAQNISQLTFRDFPVIVNVDSLEQAVQQQRNNPDKYLAGLVTI